MKRSSISIIILLATHVYVANAQKNFTMEEAVLGLATNLRVENFEQLGFVPQSEEYVYQVGSASGQALIAKTEDDEVDTIVTLAQIKNLLGADAPSRLPEIKWLDRHHAIFQSDDQLIKITRSEQGATLSRWSTIDADAEELTISEDGTIVTYCIENNLYFINGEGGSNAITDDANPHIKNGQSVHRNEFGITTGTFISPKGKFVAYYRMDESMVADYPVIDWSQTPAVVENIKYPMAGGTTHVVQIGVYDVTSGRKIYLETPQPLKDYYLTCVTWSPDERYVFVGVLTRDQRHLRLIQYDATTGRQVKELFREDDERYVEPQNPLYFLPGGKEFVWFSQRDGYMHLYRYDLNGNLLNPITYGDWIVKSIDGINDKRKELIITTTKDDPRETSIWAVDYTNGKMRKLSATKGEHTAEVSDNGRWVIDEYQNAQIPNAIELLDIQAKESKYLLEAKNTLVGYNMAKVKDVTISADDGTPLYGKIMLPYDFDANKKYPVVYYLYNGPHLQLVTNSFPQSGNLWFDYLTQHGFIVFTMDGRGSANRGLDFEQAIHDQLGTIEMRDHLQGVDYLKSLPYVDGDRMGIHGWSYGGFMTTSFMTRYPDVFKAGVAGGPVIDWEMYEIMYTERYMSSPQSNPEGYKGNNLLNHAKNLKGKLLMIHGTDDDVVVWQHSIDFIRKCVDEKVQVDYFVYPGHPHNVRGKDRVHLIQKVTDYFEQHLK